LLTATAIPFALAAIEDGDIGRAQQANFRHVCGQLPELVDQPSGELWRSLGIDPDAPRHWARRLLAEAIGHSLDHANAKPANAVPASALFGTNRDALEKL
jgi:hypothetical protein